MYLFLLSSCSPLENMSNVQSLLTRPAQRLCDFRDKGQQSGDHFQNHRLHPSPGQRRDLLGARRRFMSHLGTWARVQDWRIGPLAEGVGWSACAFSLRAEQRRAPEALLPAPGRGAAADGALAVSQEAGHRLGDVREEHDQQAGQQRPRRARQAHLRAHVRLDRGPHQHGTAHLHQAALLHRRAGHLRVKSKTFRTY